MKQRPARQVPDVNGAIVLSTRHESIVASQGQITNLRAMLLKGPDQMTVSRLILCDCTRIAAGKNGLLVSRKREVRQISVVCVDGAPDFAISYIVEVDVLPHVRQHHVSISCPL